MESIYNPATKNYKKLTVNVRISDKEVNDCFNTACKPMRNEIISNRYYASYLKHILGEDYEADHLEEIFTKLDFMKEYVNYCLLVGNPKDKDIVINSMKENNYFSKNTSRPGVTIKLFPIEYNGKLSVVKTYMYDGHSKSLRWSLEENIKNEILFQNYARTLNKTFDFISPELYAWGEIRRYQPFENSYRYKVMYLIMEYIPYMELKNCQSENITQIYNKVCSIDTNLKKKILHHNDLHSSNILVSANSPLPEVCIIDFGEASYGPRRQIY